MKFYTNQHKYYCGIDLQSLPVNSLNTQKRVQKPHFLLTSVMIISKLESQRCCNARIDLRHWDVKKIASFHCEVSREAS